MKRLFTPVSLTLALLSCKNADSQEAKDPIDYYESIKDIDDVEAAKRAAEEAATIPDSYYNNRSDPYTTPINHQYYMFTAVNVKHEEYNFNGGGFEIAYTVITSEISEYNYKPTRDYEYKAMDKLCSSFDVTQLRNYSIAKRKAYVFTSYAEASEKRQQILKTGVK